MKATMATEQSLYLGGPSAELARVEYAASYLRAAGWRITEPWWERVREAALMGFATDAEVPDGFMAESARRNELGIRRADRLIFLCKTGGGLSAGCAYELGYVCGRGMFLAASPIYIVGDPRRFIGLWEPPRPVIVTSLEEALR